MHQSILYIAPPNEWSEQPQLSVEKVKPSVQKVKTSVQKVKTSVQIIELLCANNRLTAVQMATRLGKTTRAIEMQLERLTKAGVIRRVGPKKGGCWEVIK